MLVFWSRCCSAIYLLGRLRRLARGRWMEEAAEDVRAEGNEHKCIGIEADVKENKETLISEARQRTQTVVEGGGHCISPTSALTALEGLMGFRLLVFPSPTGWKCKQNVRTPASLISRQTRKRTHARCLPCQAHTTSKIARAPPTIGPYKY
jgi:hypothetical protein